MLFIEKLTREGYFINNLHVLGLCVGVLREDGHFYLSFLMIKK